MKTILAYLGILAGRDMDALEGLLQSVVDGGGQFAPLASDLLAKVATVPDPANLVALAEALPKELANIGNLKIDPRDSPSNDI